MISFRRLSGIMVIFILTSCSTVRTPVTLDCPQLVLPADPVSPLSKISDKSTPDEVMKAWVSTAILYRDWNRIVRKQVQESS